MPETRSDRTGPYVFTATVDPGNHVATSAVDTTITNSNVMANDYIVAIPPATLEAQIDVKGCHTITNGSFKLRTGNASAGAVDPASATWTFLLFRG